MHAMQPMGLRFSDESLGTAYDRLFTEGFFGPWAAVLVDRVRIRTGDAVVDVATGTGIVARCAAIASEAAGRVVGIDLSGPMLARLATATAAA